MTSASLVESNGVRVIAAKTGLYLTRLHSSSPDSHNMTEVTCTETAAS